MKCQYRGLVPVGVLVVMLMVGAVRGEELVAGWKWEPPEDRPFPIMAWYGPGVHLLNDQVWGDMAGAGFNLCLNSFHGPEEAHHKSLELGQQHGIGVFLGGRVNWEWGEKEEDADKLAAHVKETVAKWSNEPALAAYVFKDEPHAVSFPALAKTRELLERADPGHWAYINLFPNYAPVNYLFYVRDQETRGYRYYVEHYMETVRPKVLSYDHYGIRTDDEVTPEYFDNLEIIRAAALKYEVPFWAFTLCTPLRPVFPMPTEGHLRFQLYCDLAYGAKGLQHFTYCRAEGFDGLIDHQGKRTATYDLAKRINWEIQHMGPVLVGLKSTAVFHTGPLPRGTKLFEGYGGVVSCTGGPAVLGFFDGPKGGKYLMIVNRSPAKSAEVTLKFAEGVKSVGEVDRSKAGGRVRAIEMNGGEVKLEMVAGDGRLLVIGGQR